MDACASREWPTQQAPHPRARTQHTRWSSIFTHLSTCWHFERPWPAQWCWRDRPHTQALPPWSCHPVRTCPPRRQHSLGRHNLGCTLWVEWECAYGGGDPGALSPVELWRRPSRVDACAIRAWPTQQAPHPRARTQHTRWSSIFTHLSTCWHFERPWPAQWCWRDRPHTQALPPWSCHPVRTCPQRRRRSLGHQSLGCTLWVKWEHAYGGGHPGGPPAEPWGRP